MDLIGGGSLNGHFDPVNQLPGPGFVVSSVLS